MIMKQVVNISKVSTKSSTEQQSTFWKKNIICEKWLREKSNGRRSSPQPSNGNAVYPLSMSKYE